MHRRLVHPDADRLLVVFSDIEMGAGGPTDDFPHSDWLGELLLSYNEPPYDRLAVELVFNGDTFDLLKTAFEGEYPRHISAEVALGKLRRIADAHASFFEALREFLAHRHADRRAHFVVGNHDFDLLFPEVQRAIHRELGDDPRVTFPGFELAIGDVHIEHGHQWDSMFRMEQPFFVRYRDEDILDLPWGAVALLDVAIPLQPILYHHDRLKPRDEVFALLPEVREAVINAFWHYWTRDWARSVFRGDDPVKKVQWTMLRELAYRFRTGDSEISISTHFHERLRAVSGVHRGAARPDATAAPPRPYRLLLAGHEHHATWMSYGDRKFLMTGAFRNEYMLLEGGRVQRPLPKTYAEVFLQGDHTVRSHLVEIDGPPPPPGYIPESIFNVLEPVQAHLLARSDAERRTLVDAQAKQAQAEAEEE